MKRAILLLTFILGLALLHSAAAVTPVTYSTNGSYNYTVPSTVSLIMVEAWGGGGGGGTCTACAGGGGGGGGGYARSYISVTPGSNYNFTVGNQGRGGIVGGNNAGTAGTATWFNSTTTLYADFGTGGASSGGGTGNGGRNNTGIFKFGGGNSALAAASSNGGGGGGDQNNGTNITGGFARGGIPGTANGGNAQTAGGGGGGGPGVGGGNGGSGKIIIYAFDSAYSDYFVMPIVETNQSNITPYNITFRPIDNSTGEVSYTNVITKTYIPPVSANSPTNMNIIAATYVQRKFYLDGTGNVSIANFTPYLATGTANVDFSVVDQATNNVIPGALFIMQREIGGVFTTVESMTTDVTGTASFDYVPSQRYYFTITATGYTTKTFVLDPVLFSTYTIKMLFGSSTSNTMGQDYQNVLITYNPKIFYANTSNTFTILFASVTNSYTSYAWNLSFPGGSKAGTGTNPSGTTFVSTFNITGGNIFSTANLTINYSTSLGTRSFNSTYGIVYGPNNGTFIANRNQTYGMGLIDRVLVGIVIIVIAAGIISLAVSPIAGLVVSLFLMGLFIYMGFWEWWLAGISFLVGFIMIIRRTE